MVRDYTEELYEPTAARADALAADGYARAKTLAAYKARVSAAWPGVKIESVETDDTIAALGTSRPVVVTVSLGDLSVDDAEVQLVHGPVGPHDELDGERHGASRSPPTTPTSVRPPTGARSPSTGPGRYGFTVRVVPSNPDLVTKTELGRIAWA